MDVFTQGKMKEAKLPLIHRHCPPPLCLFSLRQGRRPPFSPPPLAKDTDIEQDKTLTFHQHLSSISFSLTLSSVFDMALAFPRAAVL